MFPPIASHEGAINCFDGETGVRDVPFLWRSTGALGSGVQEDILLGQLVVEPGSDVNVFVVASGGDLVSWHDLKLNILSFL